MFPLCQRTLGTICVVAGVLYAPIAAQDTTPAAEPIPTIVLGSGTGGRLASVRSGADASLLTGGPVFDEAFSGGVRVASGDVNGDGVADTIVAPGPGSPARPLKVFSGIDYTELGSGYPYGSAYSMGVSVATGDINGDGRSDIIVGPDVGGLVRVFDLNPGGDGPVLLVEGFPYGVAFMGGVRVAAGDVNGDGHDDIVTAPASGPGNVRTYNSDATLITQGAPYGPDFAGGISVAMGDVNGDGHADVLTAPASGPGSLRVYNGANQSLLFDFFPYGPEFTGGVTLAAADLDGDGHAEIVTGAGGGAPLVRVFNGATGGFAGEIVAFPGFAGGVFVASSSPAGIRFTSNDETRFTTGQSGSFAVTTSATPSVTAVTLAGALPAGVTFTDHGDGTAALGGTPSPGTGGTYPLTFTATNGDDAPAVQAFTLLVEGPPEITSPDAVTFSVGAAESFGITATGFPAPALTVTGTLPAGVTFTDQGDGAATLAGTPEAGSGGMYPLSIAADNGVGVAAVQTFTLTVDASPAFTSADATTFAEGTAGSFSIVATAEPPIVTITASGPLPASVILVDHGGGSATLAGIPGPGTGGIYPVTLTGSNGVGPDAIQTFTLTVTDPPAITSAASTTFTVGEAGSFDVSTTGFPTPALSVSGTLPADVTFVDNLDGTATLAGTPTVTGAYPLTITATSSAGPPVAQPFSLTVACEPITITSLPASMPNGVFGVAYPGATFSQSGGPSGGTWSAAGLPAGLAVDPSTGVLTGTPTVTGVFNGSVTYSVGSGACAGLANVTIAIAPSAVNDLYTAGLGNTQIVAAGQSSPSTPFFSFAASVLANDGGPTLTVTPIAAGPTTLGGSVTLAANGAFTYTPEAGDTGDDSFSYTVTSNGVSATATVTLALGSERVWYIDGAAAPGGNGISSAPFNATTTVGDNAAADPDDSGDYLYLYPGTYAGGFAPEPGQTLWGAGAAFNPVPGLSIPSAGTPALTATVSIFADNVTISSIAIASGPVTAMVSYGTVTGLTIKNGVTVSTTTSTAVSFTNVNSTNGGAPENGINFQSVSANGAASGIVLTNVNTVAGSFTVTGTGSASSGGTIQNATLDGISLTNTRNVSLNYMNISDPARHGIFGTGVTNFALNGTLIAGAGDTAGEHGIDFGTLDTNNLLGTATITNSTITGMHQHGITVENVSGTLTMTVTDTVISNNHSTEGGDGILFQAGGSGSTAATMALTVGETTTNGCLFQSLNGDAIQVNSEASSSAGSIATLNVNGCTIDTVGGGSAAIFISGINGSVNRGIFDIRNNTLQNVELVGIGVFAGDSSELSGTIANNTVQQTGAEGIVILGDGGAAGTGSPEVQVAVRDNTVSGQVDIWPIRVRGRDGIGGTVQVQFEGNTVAVPIDGGFGGSDGINIRAEDGMNVCVDVQDVTPLGTNNASAGTGEPGSGLVGYRLGNDGSGTFALEGYTAGPVPAFFSSHSNVGSVTASGTITGGACTTP